MKAVPALLAFCIIQILGGALRGASPKDTVAIPDEGWRLWPDTKAAWKDDALYLPDEVDLAKLPANAPTGGWDMLDGTNGIVITLPSTVEQHFWGKFGFRPYTKDDYTYGGRDPEVENGNYEGVSWWWRNVAVPASFKGKLVLLHVRGARQRAEIYVNRQLVGYDIIEETSFDCDISKALRPGETNQIAIRITNPGGWMDWQDFRVMNWGKYTFQESHGFGGLDRGLTLTAHDPVYLDDTWVLNTPEVRTITAHATVRNTTGNVENGMARFTVVDPKGGAVLATKDVPVNVPANSSQDIETPISCEKAALWDLDTPRLYTLHTQLTVPRMTDEANRSFGFRWFEPRGIGQQAGLYLNGRRVRLYTAISWGYWGLNALWPTPELAEKEVRDAKELHLNMLNFHRNIGKEEVLAKQDQLGLLRYMEPGGGGQYLGPQLPNDSGSFKGALDTSGTGGEPGNFGQRYIEAKILRMGRQFRSHPSLVIYVIQNETEPDLTNPHVFYLLRAMHALDPSRVIATKSGIGPAHQAWFAPYATDPMVDDGAGYSGWHDKHTVGGPGVWQDNMYKGPNDFTHYIDDRREIVDWGEMLGAAVGDDSPLMIRQIKAHGGKSYDLKDHEEIAAAYHQFLDKWGFRGAFPTDESFFHDLGNKCYEFWGRVLETMRLCESNDILTVSGWESTAIENHSGLVDNLRNFKGDPLLISHSLAPLLPVAETRASVLRVGSTATIDLYLLNETNRPVTGRVRLTLIDPKGKSTGIGTYPAPAFVKDQFVYPVQMGLTPLLTEAGKYEVVASLEGPQIAFNSGTLTVVRTDRPELPAARIGVIGGESGEVEKELKAFPQMKVESYQDGGTYDLVIDGARGSGRVVGNAMPASLLQRVAQGTPLLVLAGEESGADGAVRALAGAGALKYGGTIPTSRASWMGDWVFVRKHPLYDGLPVNEVMKGDYQASVEACYGFLVDGPGVAIVAAYSRDHDRNIGAITFTAKLGKGRVVFHGLTKMNPIMEQRFLGNALAYLLKK